MSENTVYACLCACVCFCVYACVCGFVWGWVFAQQRVSKYVSCFLNGSFIVANSKYPLQLSDKIKRSCRSLLDEYFLSSEDAAEAWLCVSELKNAVATVYTVSLAAQIAWEGTPKHRVLLESFLSFGCRQGKLAPLALNSGYCCCICRAIVGIYYVGALVESHEIYIPFRTLLHTGFVICLTYFLT